MWRCKFHKQPTCDFPDYDVIILIILLVDVVSMLYVYIYICTYTILDYIRLYIYIYSGYILVLLSMYLAKLDWRNCRIFWPGDTLLPPSPTKKIAKSYLGGSRRPPWVTWIPPLPAKVSQKNMGPGNFKWIFFWGVPEKPHHWNSKLPKMWRSWWDWLFDWWTKSWRRQVFSFPEPQLKWNFYRNSIHSSLSIVFF